MHKIVVVEDETIIANDLKFILENDGYSVLGPCDNGLDALRIIKKSSPDLILLDINIKGEMNGIEVASKIKELGQTPFIFITSYFDEDTLKLVEQVSPTAYIVKPFRSEEVLMNVRLALKKSFKKPVPAQVKAKIFVREAGFLKPVKSEEIMFAKGEDNYTKLMMFDRKEFTISHTLKLVEEKLPRDTFCRVHKSYIINLDFIEMIEGNSLQIANQSIPIGKTYREQFFRYMEVL